MKLQNYYDNQRIMTQDRLLYSFLVYLVIMSCRMFDDLNDVGLISTRLIAWKKKSCRGPDINIQDLVWLNLQKLIETMTYDAHCWLDCLKLGKNGSDPDSCKVRPDEGLDAIAELSPGNLYTPPQTQIFTALIRNLAQELGYDVNNLIG